MRIRSLKVLTLVLFVFLILALVYSQIIQGDYYFNLSQNNRVKLIRLAAPRGVIYDRQGRVIAGVRISFNAAVLAYQLSDVSQTLDKISQVLNISRDELLSRYKRNFAVPFAPVVIARDIPKESALILECKEFEIPGLIIQTEPVRDYRYERDFSHLVGYLGKVTEEELNRYKIYGLRDTDLIGRGGVEEIFDHYLRGQPGGRQVEVNNRGYQVRTLGSRVPQAGEDLCLTVDASLQSFVSSVLEAREGACIILNPQNGEILSLVSKPDFAPSVFLDTVNGKGAASSEVKKLLLSRQAPLVNRAISAAYPPGSIFKIIVAAAGLETNQILPKSRIFCPGSFKVGKREFFCWNRDGHGSEDIYSGIGYSCNVFFYKLGLMLGPDNLAHFARKFGLGSLAGIDLPYELKGLVPSKAWKLKNRKERWYDGETANFAIGQGYLLTTPLQMAQAVSVVANGGYLIRPHILKSEESNLFHKDIGLSRQTISVIKQGMRQVIQDERGSGYNANIAGLEWAGKTGTAQSGADAPHGWFAGFYPIDQPQLVILVFLEHGGSGGGVPASIAKQILEYIIENKI